MIFETAEVDGEIRTAAFSDDEVYRYSLLITWDDTTRPVLTAICLNPSTATHLKDDPTVRRCKAFAKKHGCGGFQMLNCFALRSTDYKKLFRHADPIGPENTIPFLKDAAAHSVTVAAWGAHITERPWTFYYRGKEVAGAFPNLLCFERTQSGHPKHPLYLPSDAVLKPFAYKE